MFKVILWLSVVIVMAASSSVYGMQEDFLELEETEDLAALWAPHGRGRPTPGVQDREGSAGNRGGYI